MARLEETSLEEALARLRERYGQEVSVVHSRPVRRRGWRGLLGARGVEVFYASREGYEAWRIHAGENGDPAPSRRRRSGPDRARQEWRGEMEALLEERDFSRRVRQRVLREMSGSWSGGDPRERRLAAQLEAARILRSWIPPCEPSPSARRRGEPRVVALVGPTGVGKTTTIAKLAAHTHAVEQKRVGLLTLDTYRIGAAHQLQKYAEIMGLPLSVLSPGTGIRDTLESYRELDVVFIDTAGRSHRDQERISETAAMLGGVDGMEVHLCLSLGASRRSTLEVARNFRAVPYNRILLIKRDECSRCGALPDLFLETKTPISYITCGQEVPRDFEPAREEEILALLLGDS